jgi:glycine reductase complex component B subunit gamma
MEKSGWPPRAHEVERPNEKENFKTEVPLPVYDTVAPPPPVTDPSRMRIALVTESGLVPRGNPGRLEWFRASRWLKHGIEGKDDLKAGEYEVVHGGYDACFANEDPDRLVPVDALRTLEKGREIGALLNEYYVTCGNHAILAQMAQYAQEIASDLKRQKVDSVLLVAT